MNGRVFLIHWNAAEAEIYADQLRAFGWEVVGIETADGARGGQAVKDNLPDVLVIYLTRLPSHGRQTAFALRWYKATRTLPIVFVGGQDEALAKTKAKIPDGHFVEAEELEATLLHFRR
ncbi:MAG: hypothetical protein AB1791_20860 [Chloroflexota bacterium]